MIRHFWAMQLNHYSKYYSSTTPLSLAATPPIAKNSPIIPELFSILNEPKTVPIILKLCQHNWEKPTKDRICSFGLVYTHELHRGHNV